MAKSKSKRSKAKATEAAAEVESTEVEETASDDADADDDAAAADASDADANADADAADAAATHADDGVDDDAAVADAEDADAAADDAEPGEDADSDADADSDDDADAVAASASGIPSMRAADPGPISVTGPITGVTVYARGAWVTRRVTFAAPLPAGTRAIRITGLTPLAEPGSFRATLHGDARVLGIASRLDVPEAGRVPGELKAKARALRREEQALRERLALEKATAATLAQLVPQAAMHVRSPRYDAGAAMADARAAHSLIDDLAAANDAAIASLEAEQARLARRVQQAELAATQAAGGERVGAGHPTRTAAVRIAATGTDETVSLDYLELSYRVPAARWWPTYTVRIDPDGLEAKIEVDGWVAQCTLEDWTGVDIALATANMHRDTTLPELPMWRMGRAQKPTQRGFRPAPDGLDALFAGYDAAGIPDSRPPAKPKPVPMPPPPPPMKRETAVLATTAVAYDFDDDGTPNFLADESEDTFALEEAPMATPSMYLQQQQAPAAPKRRAGGKAKKSMSANVAATRALDLSEVGMASYGAGGAPPGGIGGMAPHAEAPADDPSVDPDDAWLAFDSLVLESEGPRRGRLVKRTAAQVDTGWEATLAAARPPGAVVDPAASREHFDHIYRATGQVDVPASSTPHRIAIETRSAEVRSRFRAVPTERSDVFREVLLRNPFDGPLLEGPADVFLAGSMIATATIESVDRGGQLTIGLGVEERLKVARNARVNEHKSGIFGGKSVVEHHVEIEVASGLGHPAQVEVVDRVPVTTDDEVEVERTAADPACESYDQSDRGNPVKGGVRWILDVPAGGKATASFDYEIKLSAKREIIGGNRRD